MQKAQANLLLLAMLAAGQLAVAAGGTLTAAPCLAAAQTKPQPLLRKQVGGDLKLTWTIRAAERRLRLHRYKQARNLFARALESNSDSVPARLGLAEALYGLKDYQKALDETDEAARRLAAMDDAEAIHHLHRLRLARGKVLHQLSRFDDAAAELTKAIDCKPEAFEGYSGRATAYDALGEKDKALADIDKAVGLAPNNADVFLQRALIYRHLGKNAEALADLDRAVALDPKLVSWRAAFNRDRGRTDQALADYTDAIFEHPSSDLLALATQYFERGTVYADLDEHRKAINDFTKAIELNPKSAVYYNSRGTSYFGASDFKHAVEDFSAAIALDPAQSDYYFRRGSGYAEDGQPERALSDFNKAIELGGKSHAVYYLKRADIESQMGNHGDAIADLTKAIEINKGDPESLLTRGLEYAASGQAQQSLDDFSACIQKRPGMADAYKNRGLSEDKLGHPRRAFADLQRSAQLYDKEGDRHNTAEVGRLINKIKKPASR